MQNESDAGWSPDSNSYVFRGVATRDYIYPHVHTRTRTHSYTYTGSDIYDTIDTMMTPSKFLVTRSKLLSLYSQL